MMVPRTDGKGVPLGAYLYCKGVEVGMSKDMTVSRMVKSLTDGRSEDGGDRLPASRADRAGARRRAEFFGVQF